MPFPAELTERRIGRPGEGWLPGVGVPDEPIVLAEHDPAWAAAFSSESVRIREALGAVALRVEHVGSTAVPGLVAKPVLDIDVWVADSDDEQAYVRALAAAGHTLVLREPWWNGHRMLCPAPGSGLRVNLHVFPRTAPEPTRHLLFRDWLRSHDDDRERYARVKRRLAASTVADPAAYNLAKNEVIDAIYARVFAVPPDEHPAWAGVADLWGTGA